MLDFRALHAGICAAIDDVLPSWTRHRRAILQHVHLEVRNCSLLTKMQNLLTVPSRHCVAFGMAAARTASEQAATAHRSLCAICHAQPPGKTSSCSAPLTSGHRTCSGPRQRPSQGQVHCTAPPCCPTAATPPARLLRSPLSPRQHPSHPLTRQERLNVA